MELNGVANLKILVEGIEDLADSNKEVRSEAFQPLVEKMKEQLLLLERYMIAYASAAQQAVSISYEENQDIRAPFWHEVRENPENYPTNRERMGGL